MNLNKKPFSFLFKRGLWIFFCLFFVPPHKSLGLTVSNLKLNKTTPVQELPFWKSKPVLVEKLRTERVIIVSVKRDDLSNGRIRFLMTGAGVVKRPKDICFQVSQQYTKLKEVSEHFKTVRYESKSRELLLVIEVLGYQAQMSLRLNPVNEDWRSELQWEVIAGHFTGMTGIIGFEKIEGDRTEMSIDAKYEAAEFPLPRILMGFALEVVIQKVAEKMRTFIEKQDEPI